MDGMTPSSLRDVRRVPPESLRWTCDPATLDFVSTASLPADAGDTPVVGQGRAVRALQFGLGITQAGYNVFVNGPPGTGRNTYTRAEVEQAARERPVPQDWIYVRNFVSASTDEPVAIPLPPGRGRTLRRDVAELVTDVREALRRAFASEAYERQRADVVRQGEQRVAEVWQGLEQQARTRGLALQRMPTGILTVPVDLQGRPLSEEVFRALPEDERTRLTNNMRDMQDLVNEAMRRVRAIEREGRDALRDLERRTAQYVIDGPVARLKEEYGQFPKVVAFLDAAERDMVDRLPEFSAGRDEDAATAPRPDLPLLPRRDPFLRYQVNLLVDHAETKGAPVVFEANPTYYNLLGKVEYRVELGALVTDVTMIKPGALHRANGGYLVLQVRDVLTSPFAYEGLKRALRGQEIRMEPLGEAAGLLPTATLRPEPIPLDVKVVLIGTPDLYYLLYTLDEEFEKLFKIRADFDVVMDRTPETQREYARAIAAICRKYGVCDFDGSAVAAVLEYSARVAADQEKLSTRFNEVGEIVFEAGAWARREGRKSATGDDVRRAIDEKISRSSMIEEKIREMIARGQLLVDTDGAAVGQINGLSVLQLGDYAFGQPSRITARAHVGSRGIVNIERETQMSGRIHSKGVFVLASFLANRFAQQQPLSVSASLTFEQQYSEVDGDSASSTELYALLSELSGLPIDQGIATTGSVNQRGEIQPIGGVNEKIEGFYYACKIKGLTGRQGVIIPPQNVRNLMLRDEVAGAARDGRFHIWTAATIDEGIEILTGTPAGIPDDAGRYPPDSVNGRAAARLAELARRYRDFRETAERPEGGPRASPAA
jgi:lon-related putative ATP-dependent protease